MKTVKHKPSSLSHHYGIVVARFNDFITKRLQDGCLDELSKGGVKKTQMTVVEVPGSFELPATALRLAKRKSVDAVICLGAVIRGETFHFEIVAREASRGIMDASLMTGKPIIFGVLTTDTVDQAYKRSGEKGDNKGRDAARAAMAMLETLQGM